MGSTRRAGTALDTCDIEPASKPSSAPAARMFRQDNEIRTKRKPLSREPGSCPTEPREKRKKRERHGKTDVSRRTAERKANPRDRRRHGTRRSHERGLRAAWCDGLHLRTQGRRS